MVSSVILGMPPEIFGDEYVILSPTEMPKRETIGERLRRERLAKRLTVPQLKARIFSQLRAEISEATLHDIEKDRTANPGRKTVEFIALGLGLDPLEVFALGLDDPTQSEPGYKNSQLAHLQRIYPAVKKSERPFVDGLIRMLIDEMERRC